MNERVVKNWLYPDMPDTVRHINMDNVSPSMWPAIWEYSRGYSGEIKPTLFSIQLNRDCLDVLSPCFFEDLVNMEDLTEDIQLVRSLVMTEVPHSSVFLATRGVLIFELHLPLNIKRTFVKNGLTLSVVKLLKDRGLSCKARGNDCYALIGDKEKKFSGALVQPWPSGWATYECLVTVNIDTTLLDKYLKKDAILSRKGEYPKEVFGNFICGLDELDSNIKTDTLIEPFINNLSEKLDINIIKGELDIEENRYLNELAVALNKPSWIIQSIHPDLGDLR